MNPLHEIESRYRRLNTEQRRPSMEYVTVQEIRNIFNPYVEDKETFSKLSEDELRKMFDEFMKKNNNGDYSQYMILPEIEN
jgi:hypothetical protein